MPRTITYTRGILLRTPDAFRDELRHLGRRDRPRLAVRVGFPSVSAGYPTQKRNEVLSLSSRPSRSSPRPQRAPSHNPESDAPENPKNQTANASPATKTEMIITRSSTPPRRSTVRSPRIERVQPGRYSSTSVPRWE